jgi:hypothetical protein
MNTDAALGLPRNCRSFDKIATHAAEANPQAGGVLLDLLHGWARPMRLKGFWACIDLVQHDRVVFLLRQEDVEFQGAGFGRQATLTMSL